MHEAYVRQAIESILMQKTDFGFELVICDDHSTDNTTPIVEQMKLNHPEGYKIRFYRHPKNVGMHLNSLYSSRQCRGKYIALCEGDDYWTDPLKLQKQVDFMERHQDFTGIFTNAQVQNIERNKTYPFVKNMTEGEVNLKSILSKGGVIYPTASLLFRSNILQKIDSTLFIQMPEDTLIIVMTGIHGKVYFMNEITCVYRMWSGSVFGLVRNDKRKEAAWKERHLKGYVSIKKIVPDELRSVLQDKISKNSLFIILNSSKFNRIQYIFNLGKQDSIMLLEYCKVFFFQKLRKFKSKLLKFNISYVYF